MGLKVASSFGAMSIVELKGGTWKQKQDTGMALSWEIVLSSLQSSCSSVHSLGLFHGVGFDQPQQAASWKLSNWTTDSSAKMTLGDSFRTPSRANLSSFPGWKMTLV